MEDASMSQTRALAACRKIAKLLELPRGSDYIHLVEEVERLVVERRKTELNKGGKKKVMTADG